MANLIDKSYFVFEIDLPDGQWSNLLNYITRFEKEILQKLLGYELYALVVASTETSGRLYDLINGKEYTIELNGRNQKVKWNGLKNADKVSLIAYYVYYQYQRGKVILQTQTGAVTPTHENSANADLSVRIMGAWSRLRDLYGYSGQADIDPSAYNFLTKYADTYPEWLFTEIGNVNAFDL